MEHFGFVLFHVVQHGWMLLETSALAQWYLTYKVTFGQISCRYLFICRFAKLNVENQSPLQDLSSQPNPKLKLKPGPNP